MTPVFCCGFECQQLGAVGRHWPSAAYASINNVLGNVKTGAASLRINPSGVATSSFVFQGATLSGTTAVCRFYIIFDSLPTTDLPILQYFTSLPLTIGGVFFKQSDSKIYAHTGEFSKRSKTW